RYGLVRRGVGNVCSISLLQPKRFQGGFEGGFEIGHCFDHLRLNLRPLRLRAPIATPLDDMLDPAGALGVEPFPGKRPAEGHFDFVFASVELIEDAFVFDDLAAIDVEFGDSIFLDDRVVEPEAADTRTATKPMVGAWFPVGVTRL